MVAKNSPKTPAPRPATYTVQVGDNLTHIARETGIEADQLREWNQLPADGGVQAGQRLRLTAGPASAEAAAPAKTRATAAEKTRHTLPGMHTVQPGDTLYNISKRFNLSMDELRRLNHLTTDEVKLGQKLVVQAG